MSRLLDELRSFHGALKRDMRALERAHDEASDPARHARSVLAERERLSTPLTDVQDFDEGQGSGRPHATRSEWDRSVEAIQRAWPDELLVGYHLTERYPITLGIPTLLEHAHITGGSGSGKTSRTVLPFLKQLIRLPRGHKHRGPVLVLDLKAEDYLFHALREEAHRAGRKFRFFTNMPRTTHAYNTLADLSELGISLLEVGETLRAAFNVEHGTGYGKGHFSAISASWLSKLLLDFYSQFGHEPRNFYELEVFRAHRFGYISKLDQEQEKKSDELTQALSTLSGIASLNVTRETGGNLYPERISTARALEDDEVLYFLLKTNLDERTSRHIASLALSAFYSAAFKRNIIDEPDALKPAYVFIDEFQRMAGRHFVSFLQQARSAGVPLLLCNQARADLNESEVINATDENTGFRQFYTAKTPQSLKFLKDLSGETEEAYVDEIPLPGEEMRVRLRRTSRFSMNDLHAMSAMKGASLVHFGDDDGGHLVFHGQFVPIYSPFSVTREAHQRLKTSKWPALTSAQMPYSPPLPPQLEGRRIRMPGPPRATAPRAPDVRVAAAPSAPAREQMAPRASAPAPSALREQLSRIRLGLDRYIIESER